METEKQLEFLQQCATAILYCHNSQSIMRTKTGGSTPKFVRRTSKSPWQPAKNNHPVEHQPLNYFIPSNPISVIPNRNLTPGAFFKQPTTSICTIPDDSFSKKQNSSKLINYYAPTLDKFQQLKHISNSLKDPEDIKLTYIPIESVSTVQSLPTTRKKLTEHFQPPLDTKRLEQLANVKRDMQKLMDQHKILLENQKQKAIQNSRLTEQVDRAKKNSARLENQVRQLKLSLGNSQKELRHSKIAFDNLKRSFEVNQMIKLKADERAKQLLQRLNKLDADLKIQRQENRDLKRMMETKQRQLKIANNEISNQAKTLKNSYSSNLENRQFDTKVLLTRSISIQQNFPPADKKQATMLVRTKESLVRLQQKCNRYVQTENSKLEFALKQNQVLESTVMSKNHTMRCMQQQMGNMQTRLRTMDELIQKTQQSEILIEVLNCQIMKHQASALANKYKYY